VVRGKLPRSPSAGEPFDAGAAAERLRPNAHHLSVAREFDDPVAGFGRRFWQALAGVPAVGAWLRSAPVPVRVAYSDRYLLSPLALRLLHAVLRECPLRRALPEGQRLPLRVHTLAVRRDGRMRLADGFKDDWPDGATRDDVLRAVLGVAGYEVGLQTGDARDIPHARRLRIETADHGRLELLLDHGFGHWRAARRVAFDFTASRAAQGATLLRAEFEVATEAGSRTEIFVEISP
jgi:hypothetical protein